MKHEVSNKQATMGLCVGKRRGVKIYEKNPFFVQPNSKIKRIVNKTGDKALVNRKTGELEADIAGFWVSKVVDDTKFLKLYLDGVKAFQELGSSGIKVFEYLYLTVRDAVSQDRIYLSHSLVEESYKISKATYARGLNELMKKGFIAATPQQGMYWLNPSYIWNGDRLAFVQSYQREGNGKSDKLMAENEEKQTQNDEINDTNNDKADETTGDLFPKND